MNTQEIQTLKSSLRIEEVIARYLPLNRSGNHYTGLCPFHADHHPSLAVSPDRQTYACFSCGAKGDVFAFIQQIEQCTFAEALSRLKRDNGESKMEKRELKMNTKETLTPPDQPAIAERNQRFLSALLPYASGHTELSSAYLDFEVGQSPTLVPKQWNTMRNRIIFPIRDEEARLVGFAARRLDDTNTETPKYINTSARDGYHKGETLYGLHRAKEAIQKTGIIFVTEGYKDTIAMHAAGFTNTVALSGTALTAAHILLIKKYAARVYLLLDADPPGRAAASKALSMLVAAHIEAENVALPPDHDPDSLFRQWGKKAFAAMLRKLADRPHSSESGLLAACLLYPDTLYPFKGITCRFTEMLYSILPVDNLAFENKEYRQILRHLSDGGTEATLPPVLQLVANELHLDFDHMLRQDLSLLARMLPDADNHTVIYLGKLLFLYAEIRLLRQIRQQIETLLSTPSEDTRKRTSLLLGIAHRRELLRHVSECEGRPGTVPS